MPNPLAYSAGLTSRLTSAFTRRLHRHPWLAAAFYTAGAIGLIWQLATT